MKIIKYELEEKKFNGVLYELIEEKNSLKEFLDYLINNHLTLMKYEFNNLCVTVTTSNYITKRISFKDFLSVCEDKGTLTAVQTAFLGA